MFCLFLSFCSAPCSLRTGPRKMLAGISRRTIATTLYSLWSSLVFRRSSSHTPQRGVCVSLLQRPIPWSGRSTSYLLRWAGLYSSTRRWLFPASRPSASALWAGLCIRWRRSSNHRNPTPVSSQLLSLQSAPAVKVPETLLSLSVLFFRGLLMQQTAV